MTRRIAILTGSRGEWGYIRPIMRLIEQDPALSYQLIVTHMHLLPEFGYSIEEIERDGFEVHEQISMTMAGYTGVTMTKSLGVLLLELPTALKRLKPDILLLSGDRGEQLMGAIAGNHLSLPVAHIQAGELSGNVDGIVRHAITKLAHIHFAANEEFAERVLRLGEQPFRVHVTGAPLVDEMVQGKISTPEELARRYRIDPTAPLLLAVQHPVTEEETLAGRQVKATLRAVSRVGWQTIFIYPNADSGSALVRAELSEHQRGKIHFLRNLPRADYLGFMKLARAMVGNSSSGIMEAPSLGTPAVNIGRRQNGRPQGANVINCQYDEDGIHAAILQAASDEFRAKARQAKNPYGDGKASQRIVEVLKTVNIGSELLNKEMTY